MIRDIYDSGILKGRDQYTRDIVWTDPTESLILVTRIRVHRQPSQSYAKIEMWEQDHWVKIDSLPVLNFWYDLPGFDRPDQDRTRRRTRAISEELVRGQVNPGTEVVHAYG